MLKYLIVCKSQFGLKTFLRSVLSKIQRNIVLSLRLCKKIASAFVHLDMVPKHWLRKPEFNIESNFAGSGPMISVLINGRPVSTILDTG